MNAQTRELYPNDFLPIRNGHGSFSGPRTVKRCDNSWLKRQGSDIEEQPLKMNEANPLKKENAAANSVVKKAEETKFKLEFEPEFEPEDDDDADSLDSGLYGSSSSLRLYSSSGKLGNSRSSLRSNDCLPLRRASQKILDDEQASLMNKSDASEATRTTVDDSTMHSESAKTSKLSKEERKRAKKKKDKKAKKEKDGKKKQKKSKKDKKEKSQKEEKIAKKEAKIPKAILIRSESEGSGDEASNAEEIISQLKDMNASWASLSLNDSSSRLSINETLIGSSSILSNGPSLSMHATPSIDLRPSEFLPFRPRDPAATSRNSIKAKNDVSWINRN